MKVTTYDALTSLSPERRKEIEQMAAEAGRQSDEYMRRVCTPFGYKHGYYWALLRWVFATLFIAIAGVTAFAFLAPVDQMTLQEKSGVLIGIGSVPLLVIPVLLFVFLKARYAIRVLGVLVGVVIIGQVLFGIIDPLIHIAVDALIAA